MITKVQISRTSLNIFSLFSVFTEVTTITKDKITIEKEHFTTEFFFDENVTKDLFELPPILKKDQNSSIREKVIKRTSEERSIKIEENISEVLFDGSINFCKAFEDYKKYIQKAKSRPRVYDGGDLEIRIFSGEKISYECQGKWIFDRIVKKSNKDRGLLIDPFDNCCDKAIRLSNTIRQIVNDNSLQLIAREFDDVE